MKTTLKTLLCAFLIFTIGLKAQNSKQKIKVNKVWVTLLDGSKIKGNLYSADNEGIIITKNNSIDSNDLTTISTENIHLIRIRRKGKVIKGMLIGSLTGVGISVLLGATSGDSGWFTPAETMAIAGVLFVPLGAGIGALAGTKKENIYIRGTIKTYQLELKKIQSYSLHLQ